MCPNEVASYQIVWDAVIKTLAKCLITNCWNHAKEERISITTIHMAQCEDYGYYIK